MPSMPSLKGLLPLFLLSIFAFRMVSEGKERKPDRNSVEDHRIEAPPEGIEGPKAPVSKGPAEGWISVGQGKGNPAFRRKGTVLVKYREDISIHKVRARVGKSPVKAAYRKSRRHEVVHFHEGLADFESVRKDLLKDPEISAVEPDLQLKSLGKVPEYHKRNLSASQWSMRKANRQFGRKGGESIKGRKSSRKARVGILDTGLDFLHPDLDGRIAKGVNLIQGGGIPGAEASKEDKDATEMDYNGHGTLVAGLIGAEWNGEGIDGLNDEVELVGIKVFNRDGYASLGDVIAGVRWAIENRIDVLNMSFGTYERSALLEEILAEAAGAGMLLVAAAGNDYADDIMYPARYSMVLSAGSHDDQGGIARFSNWNRQITIFAPGTGMLSTQTTQSGGHNAYERFSGTSASAAYVTGILSHFAGREKDRARAIRLLGETPVLRRPQFGPRPGAFAELNTEVMLAESERKGLARASITGIHGQLALLDRKGEVNLKVHFQNTGTRTLPASRMLVTWEAGALTRSLDVGPVGELPPGKEDSLAYAGKVPGDLPQDAPWANLRFSLASGNLEEEGNTAELRFSDLPLPLVKVDGLWITPLDFSREDSTDYTLGINLYNAGNLPLDDIMVSPYVKAAVHCGVNKAESHRIGPDFMVGTLAPGEIRRITFPVPDFRAPPQDLTLYAKVTSNGIEIDHATQTYHYLEKDQVRIEYAQDVHKHIADEAVKLLALQGIDLPDMAAGSALRGSLAGPNNSWSHAVLPCNQLRVYGDGSLYKAWCSGSLGGVTSGNITWGAGANPAAPYWGDQVFANFGITPNLINGAFDKDETDIAYNYDWKDMFDTHYWIVGNKNHPHSNPDDNGLNSGGSNHHSALTNLRALFKGGTTADVGGTDNRLTKGAIDHYLAGHKKAAWWFVGHALHLIGDLSVPSHVRDENSHGVFGCAYHDWMDSHYGNYTAGTALDWGGFIDPLQPAAEGDPIRFLAYTTAQLGDAFPWASWKLPMAEWTGYITPSLEGAHGERTFDGAFPHYDTFLNQEFSKAGITAGGDQTCVVSGNVTHSAPYCKYHINKDEVKDYCAVTGPFCWCCTECQAVDVYLGSVGTGEERRDCWNGGDGVVDKDNTDGGGTDFNDRSLDKIGKANMNYAIRAAAGLLYYFAVQTGQYTPPPPAAAIPHVTEIGTSAFRETTWPVSAGETVRLFGRNFHYPNVTREVFFNGIKGQLLGSGYYGATTEWIEAIVPEGATTGKVLMSANGVSGTSAVSAIFRPVVTGATPSSGRPGETVKLAGRNLVFDGYPNGVNIGFKEHGGWLWGPVNSVSPQELTTSVPAGTESGVVVRVQYNAIGSELDTEAYVFTIQPLLTSINPTHGPAGSVVELTGGDWRQQPIIRIGGMVANTWHSSSDWKKLWFTLPAGAKTGDITVSRLSASGNDEATSVGKHFVIDPVLSSLSPSDGLAGATVRIQGLHFPEAEGANVVMFNGVQAAVVANTATTLDVTVPGSGSTGPVTVSVSGVVSNGSVFTYRPQIASLGKNSGFPGQTVVITGANFMSNPSQNVVKFNGKPALVLSAGTTSLNVKIPPATSGPLTVSVNGVVSEGTPFTIKHLVPILIPLLQ